MAEFIIRRTHSLIIIKGKDLLQVIQITNYSTETPTYWPYHENKIPELLDFYVTSGIFSNYTNIVSSCDLSLDHNTIITIIRTTLIAK